MATPFRVYLTAGLISLAISTATAFFIVKYVTPPSAAETQQTAASPALPKTIVEEGEIEITVLSDRKGTAQQFYRVPFASPPQLTFPGESTPGYWNAQVLDQTAEGFKITRDVSNISAYSPSITFKWRAEGLPKP